MCFKLAVLDSNASVSFPSIASNGFTIWMPSTVLFPVDSGGAVASFHFGVETESVNNPAPSTIHFFYVNSEIKRVRQFDGMIYFPSLRYSRNHLNKCEVEELLLKTV